MWNDGTSLYHYGIQGQKWGQRRFQNEDGSYTEEGKRRYGRNTQNPNYTFEQRERDRRVYGRGGVRRINRHMNEGAQISTARSAEASRIRSARANAIFTGHAGAVVGTAAGAIAGAKYTEEIMKRFNLPIDDPVISYAIRGGMVAIGASLGRLGGRSVSMVAKGYSPNKFRYN